MTEVQRVRDPEGHEDGVLKALMALGADESPKPLPLEELTANYPGVKPSPATILRAAKRLAAEGHIKMVRDPKNPRLPYTYSIPKKSARIIEVAAQPSNEQALTGMGEAIDNLLANLGAAQEALQAKLNVSRSLNEEIAGLRSQVISYQRRVQIVRDALDGKVTTTNPRKQRVLQTA